jgi:hypothetical protein
MPPYVFWLISGPSGVVLGWSYVQRRLAQAFAPAFMTESSFIGGLMWLQKCFDNAVEL